MLLFRVASSTITTKLVTATAIGAGIATVIAVATALALVLSTNNTSKFEILPYA